MNFFSTFKKLGITISIALIILGIAFIAIPHKIINLIDWIVGVGVFFIGITGIIKTLKDPTITEGKGLKMVPSVICIIFALYILIFAGSTTNIIGIIIGILAIFAAIGQFSNAKIANLMGQKGGTYVVMGLVNILFSIAMFVASFTMVSFLIMLIGIYLVILGGTSLFSAITLKPMPDTENSTAAGKNDTSPSFIEEDTTIVDAEVVDENEKQK